MMKEITLKIYKERILRVLVYIQENLDEKMELYNLARIAHFSPYHFHRVFRGMVGESVKGHVRRLRLERSAARLMVTRWTIIRIAFEAGYESNEAFTRAFCEMFKETPSSFRVKRGSVSFIKAPSGVHYSRKGKVKHFKTAYKGEKEMIDVKLKKIDSMKVAFMRHVGPYVECGKTWCKFCAWAGAKGLLGPNVQCLGICHDDPEVTPPEKIRYDACIPVSEDFIAEGDVGVQVICGGEYATTTHIGPYEKLGETYAKLMGEWLPRSGRELKSAPCFEVYLNDPGSTAPEDLLTEIHVPLN
jgi:AraC family transcriptional regulator